MEKQKQYKLNRVAVRLVEEAPVLSSRPFDSPEAAVDAVGDIMREFDREVVAVISLNSKCIPVNVSFASAGTVGRTIFSPHEIVKNCLLSNASRVIVMHNHPSGDPKPSPEDIRVTDMLAKALALVEIELLDHVIIGGGFGEWYSMQENDVLKKPKIHLASCVSEIAFADAFRKDAVEFLGSREVEEEIA